MTKQKFILIIFMFLFLVGVTTVLAHGDDENGARVGGGLILFLENNRDGVLIFHILGIVLGLGMATMSDFFFFKFLKDRRISEKEEKVLKTFSKIIWAGLTVLILSGVGLYLPHGNDLLKSPKFLAKMVVVGVIIVNGILLNTLISPKLTKIMFLPRWRRLAFALGAISIVSWYAAFILGMWRNLPFGFAYIFGTYLIFLAMAVTISQILERVWAHRVKN